MVCIGLWQEETWTEFGHIIHYGVSTDFQWLFPVVQIFQREIKCPRIEKKKVIYLALSRDDCLSASLKLGGIGL